LESLASIYLGDSGAARRIAEYNQVQNAQAGLRLVIPLQPIAPGGLRPDGYQVVPILCYPRIGPEKRSVRGVTARIFEGQMQFLRENGYTTISLERSSDFLNLSDQLPPKALVITFDSAERWVYDIAYPILKRNGFTAALFVSTLQIGKPRHMTWEELAALAADGFDIGSNGVRARPLSSIPKNKPEEYIRSVVEEISLSKNTIAQNLKKECSYFAYPGGTTNDLVIALLKKQGYRGAFTQEGGGNPFFVDHFKVRRTIIGSQETEARLRQHIEGFHPTQLLETGQPAALGGTATPRTPELDYFRERAAALEAQGDLPQALFTWRVVAALDPGNSGVTKKIEALAANISEAAKDHYKRGVVLFRAKELEKARNEFLAALCLNPGHAQALFYLKKRLNQPDAEIHAVQPGDSFRQIAAKRYNDPSKAAIIAYFNELDPDKPLRTDTLLLLPELGAEKLLPLQEVNALLERAQQALDEKKYTEVLVLTARVGENQTAQARIQALNDAARFGQGMLLMEQKQYTPALEMFNKLSPNYKDRDRAIQQALQRIQSQASEEKLRAAQAQFKQGAYAAVILTCKQVLEENPDNPKAQALSESAHYALGKQYLDRGEEILAMETLKGLNPEYQDTAQLLAQAQGRLNARAEEYYRRGVKHFLNEELEEAVAAWQKALELNPQHPKARQDMDNALRLLDKWRGLEKSDKKGQ
ncbi:MAG: tetratricopeptide repeat protein, partial [Desulfatitalea sp.]|nr:tetratricopeptide repeat protein [Desulfatitalea sp.]